MVFLREATNLGTTLLWGILERKQGTPNFHPFKETVVVLTYLITFSSPFCGSISSSDLGKSKYIHTHTTAVLPEEQTNMLSLFSLSKRVAISSWVASSSSLHSCSCFIFSIRASTSQTDSVDLKRSEKHLISMSQELWQKSSRNQITTQLTSFIYIFKYWVPEENNSQKKSVLTQCSHLVIIFSQLDPWYFLAYF